MELQGSCRCGGVKFSCLSHTPYPYMRCYCSICRKLAGGGGFAINIMAQVQCGQAVLVCSRGAVPLRARRAGAAVQTAE